MKRQLVTIGSERFTFVHVIMYILEEALMYVLSNAVYEAWCLC